MEEPGHWRTLINLPKGLAGLGRPIALIVFQDIPVISSFCSVTHQLRIFETCADQIVWQCLASTPGCTIDVQLGVAHIDDFVQTKSERVGGWQVLLLSSGSHAISRPMLILLTSLAGADFVGSLHFGNLAQFESWFSGPNISSYPVSSHRKPFSSPWVLYLACLKVIWTQQRHALS